MHQSTRLLVYGFIVIMIMMVFLAFIAFQLNDNSSQLFGSTITKQLEKNRLVAGISEIVHDRTRFLQSMLLYQDTQDSSMVWNDFKQYTTSYANLRQRLLEISTPLEKNAIWAVDSSIEETTGLIRQLLIIFLDGNLELANEILLNEVFPKTALILDSYSSMRRSLRTELSDQLLQANSEAEINQATFVNYAVFTLVISLGIAVFAIWYNQRLSTQLQEINTYLEEKVYERTENLLDTQKELIEDNSELARLASTDNLTGLSNRSYMSEILEKEYSRYTRHNQLFGIIMLDIDHFKKINDDYGHDIGDKVLIQLSRQLEQAIRNSDYISRWGGEEFMICCTTINPDDLLPISETIRLKISSTEFDISEDITASLGCAIIQPDEKIEELIKRADVALYAAKNSGRNQTVISEFSEFI